MAKITLTNNGTTDQSIMNHMAARLNVPAGESVVIALNPAKDITSQAFLKKFYGQYDAILEAEYDIDDYPLDYEKFTVEFDTDGGSEVESQEVYGGEKATRPAEDPTKAESTFGGWYADEGKTTEFDFDEPITEDTTVYAKWSAAAGNKNAKSAGGIDTVAAPKAEAKEEKKVAEPKKADKK